MDAPPRTATPLPSPPVRSHPKPRRRRPLGLLLLLPLQIFLAAGWLRAGVEKVIEVDWWTGAQLSEFLAVQRPQMLPFFTWFADHVISPLMLAVAVLVVVAQLAIGLCLVANRHVRAALWAGVALNLTFTLAGRVNPSAFYLVMELALLFALSRPTTIEVALRRAALWAVPAVVLLPFARTVQPSHVIDDPALMLSFLAALAATSSLAPHREDLERRILASTTARRLGSSLRRQLERSGRDAESSGSGDDTPSRVG